MQLYTRTMGGREESANHTKVMQ